MKESLIDAISGTVHFPAKPAGGGARGGTCVEIIKLSFGFNYSPCAFFDFFQLGGILSVLNESSHARAGGHEHAFRYCACPFGFVAAACPRNLIDVSSCAVNA